MVAEGNDVKKKIAVIGVATLLVMTGVALWYYLRPLQEASERENDSKQAKRSHAGVSRSVKPSPVDQDVSEEQTPRLMESDTEIQDERKQIEEFLEWLDSLEDDSMNYSEVGEEAEEAEEERKEIYRGMTREEVEEKLVEIDKEVYRGLETFGTIYTEVMDITQGRKPCPPGTIVEEMWAEGEKAVRDATRLYAIKRVPYARALEIDAFAPFKSGGWAYELIKHTNRRPFARNAGG